ncbi:MAG: glycoside hydrolase family 71/99-like protein [Bacteroidota bacterium]
MNVLLYSPNNLPDLLTKIGILLMTAAFIYSCEEPDLSVVETPIETVQTVTDTTYTDEELLEVLNEEIDLLETTGGRVVNISGMDVPKENPKTVYVHYMPWFQSKDYDGYWGQHWTMTNQDPEIIDENGQRQIASYYYPIIGPYSSNDPDLHEYHFLMMKMAGVDGVIFDWYGSRDQYDYGLIKDATESFIWTMEDLGLDFSIMYEDRVAVHAAQQGLAPTAIAAAQDDFEYINEVYFSSPRYMKHNDNNLLFVFGPHYLTTSSEWDQIFNVLPQENRPDFLTLWAAQHLVGENAAGEFLWIAPDHLAAHDYYYNYYPENNEITVGSVYPGFKSFYVDGGWSEGINEWVIEDNGGDTFVETLTYTHHEVADFIQIATWNDFGEGTMIEPTEEHGFMYLQLLQQYTGVDFTPEDLQVALDLYRARKQYKDNAQVQLFLDRSYEYLKQLRIRRVKRILRAIDRFYS